jgi:hypothetical protein
MKKEVSLPHPLYRLCYRMLLLLKELKRSVTCLSLGTIFLSIYVIKCDIPIFGGNNSLSHDVITMLFEGHLRKALWFQCAATSLALPLGISERISMNGLSSQGVNTKRTHLPYLCSL